ELIWSSTACTCSIARSPRWMPARGRGESPHLSNVGGGAYAPEGLAGGHEGAVVLDRVLHAGLEQPGAGFHAGQRRVRADAPVREPAAVVEGIGDRALGRAFGLQLH